ncbi:F-box domain-containing protein [Rhypophila decipiens]|uniref:F-box domain-containing protein n=1 Tax=Rhypophila decipiens TaxID=261697 RepID=A0AAN7B9F2_9PEZI|nr:F-box domain-containing protein [Rhypophila decipiens]
MDNRQDARADEAGIPESDETGLHETSNAQTESEPPAGVVPCEHSSTPSHMSASSSVNLSSVPPALDLRPTTPPRGILEDWGDEESSSQADKRKGKGKEIAHDSAKAAGQCRLISLPPELIDSILSFLSPIDLAFLSATCRLLYTHGTGDHLWQTIVQDHVPGIRVTSPYPFESFYQLYKAHDPHWFLPKHKIWFSDGDLAGRLILTRYDQRRGCIEGYQLVAVSSRKNSEPWLADSDLEVMIHAFEPKVKLHLDKPILHLPACRRDDRQAGELASVGGIQFVNLRSGGVISTPLHPDNQDEASSGSKGVSADTGTERPSPRNRFQAEVSMESGTMDNAYCNLILARPVDHAVVAKGSALPFPYGNIWPPLVIPAQQRAVGCGIPNNSVDMMSLVNDKPTSRQELSDQIFRIRKGLHMRIPSSGLLGGREPTLAEAAGWAEVTNGGPAALLSMILPTPLGLNIGEAVSTYSTLDPALYTPTPEKPFRGIWVGDYSGHGCEFLLIHQPDDTPENAFDPDSVQRREDESDEQFEKRKHDEMVYRGRLEAIKLTGDPNVPRGEYTFVADDIGEGGFVTVVQHEPFTGTRVVKSKGHIAHTGFIDGHYIESQLLLISHDRLAQYWVGWRHISFFERVDIDEFLVPE